MEAKKRNKSFLQKLKNGNGSKESGNSNKGYEFRKSWMLEMEKITSDADPTAKLVPHPNFPDCICLAREMGSKLKYLDQIHSCSSWQVFHLFWKVQAKGINSANLTKDQHVFILESLNKPGESVAHTCGNGRIGKQANKNPVCVKESHLKLSSQKSNEEHKCFHFFLNYNSEDREFQEKVRMASKELFGNTEPFKTLYEKHVSK